MIGDLLDMFAGTGPLSLESAVLPALADAGRLVGRLYRGPFIDIGVPDELARAQTAIPQMCRRPAAFLKRDGVLIASHDHPQDTARLRWVEGSLEAVRLLNDAGTYVFVVSGQPDPTDGRHLESQEHALHRRMAEQLAEVGAHVDAFAQFPCPSKATRPAHRQDRRQGSAAPGMVADLLADWSVCIARSFFIGDNDCAAAAATTAELTAHRFTGGSLVALTSSLLARHGTA